MWTIATSLLGFIFANGDQLVAAGKSITGLVKEIIGMITGNARAGMTDLTKDQFNAFVDKALGSSSELDQIIADLKDEIARQ